jgi:hypothetical protein
MPTHDHARDVRRPGPAEGLAFDGLARRVADGRVSRGGALKLAGSAILGAALGIPVLSRLALAGGGPPCSSCAGKGSGGLCSTINPDSTFEPCCVDTSTLTTPGPEVASDCICFRTLQLTRSGRITIAPACLPTDQSCHTLPECSRRGGGDGSGRGGARGFGCPQGTICVIGSCCNTAAEFKRGIGVCVRTETCEPVTTLTAGASASGRGRTLTTPA